MQPFAIQPGTDSVRTFANASLIWNSPSCQLCVSAPSSLYLECPWQYNFISRAINRVSVSELDSSVRQAVLTTLAELKAHLEQNPPIPHFIDQERQQRVPIWQLAGKLQIDPVFSRDPLISRAAQELLDKGTKLRFGGTEEVNDFISTRIYRADLDLFPTKETELKVVKAAMRVYGL